MMNVNLVLQQHLKRGVFMKVTIIGFWGGYPAAGGATSAYLVEEKDFKLLVDAGSGSLSKLQSYINISDLDAVIVSHYHQDHVADIGVLQYAKLVGSYVTEEKDILPIYGHTEDKQGFAALTHHYTKGVAYDANGTLEIEQLSITFLETDHRVPCCGKRSTNGENTIVYTADTTYQEAWIDFAKNAEVRISDCNFYGGQDGAQTGHMTSKEGAVIAEKAHVKQLILSHLPQYGELNQLVSEAKQYYHGPVQLAKEGLVWKNVEK